jgi:hypothetical protein
MVVGGANCLSCANLRASAGVVSPSPPPRTATGAEPSDDRRPTSTAVSASTSHGAERHERPPLAKRDHRVPPDGGCAGHESLRERGTLVGVEALAEPIDDLGVEAAIRARRGFLQPVAQLLGIRSRKR